MFTRLVLGRGPRGGSGGGAGTPAATAPAVRPRFRGSSGVTLLGRMRAPCTCRPPSQPPGAVSPQKRRREPPGQRRNHETLQVRSHFPALLIHPQSVGGSFPPWILQIPFHFQTSLYDDHRGQASFVPRVGPFIDLGLGRPLYYRQIKGATCEPSRSRIQT